MPAVVIDQLLFGYRDGHELLAGSIDIHARLEAELLPHADARFEDESDHYLVGLWISALDRFMLTRIWRAPELPRPGAVWAHALLLKGHDLEEVDPAVLINAFRRPNKSGLNDYGEKIVVDAQGSPSDVESVQQLILALSEAVYEPTKTGTVVIWPAGDSAEAGLLAVWRGLPRPMRRSISFRTRGRARTGASRYGVQVATQLAGRSATQEVRVIWPAKANPPSDIRLLASIAFDPDGPLSMAVASYASNLAHARFVASTWPLVEAGDTRAVMAQFEDHHNLAPRIFGESLFAPAVGGRELWHVTEAQRVEVLLHARSNEYLDMLDLGRMGSAWQSDKARMLGLLDGRHDLADSAAALLLVSSIDQLATGEIVARIEDYELVDSALSARGDLLRDPQFWVALEHSANEGLRVNALAAAGPEVVPILLHEDLWGLLHEALDRPEMFGLIAGRLAKANPTSLSVWENAMSGYASRLVALLSRAATCPAEVVVLAAATLPQEDLASVPLRRWLEVAPAMHKRQDEASAVASARLIASTFRRKEPGARELLIECFGPAHNALESGNLPPSTVADLKASLPSPKAKSLVSRLNRALITSMESSNWTEQELRRALENAGPEARRLVKLVPKKHPLRRRIEATLHDLEELLPLP